jgi:hypothetical protein
MFGSLSWLEAATIAFEVLGLWLVPIIAAIWALRTLGLLRKGQDEIRRRLDAVDRHLQQR